DGGNPLSVEVLAQQVVAASEAAGMARFDLVGYSLGACVAIGLAAQYPERVRSLVLLAGFTGGSPDSRLSLQFELWLNLIRTEPRLFAKLVLLTGFSPAFLSQLTDNDLAMWQDAICTSN